MPELVPHRRATGFDGSNREYRSPITGRNFHEGLRPVTVELADSTQGRGSCLGCRDAPCMMLAETEMDLPQVIKEFPGNPSKEVCPTQAITWGATDQFVQVNEGTCIGCGLCVARCPYGAISLGGRGVAVVEAGDPDGLTVGTPNVPNRLGHPETVAMGRIAPMDLAAVRQMPESIAGMYSHVANRFVRNLLIACGVQCRIHRPGDTNVRMDGVLATADGNLGVLEIEFGGEPLDSLRAVLEDVAVLHSRYGIELDVIAPVSVVGELPNARSEYFLVIQDVEDVLRLRCRTLTVGALLAVLWGFQRIEGFAEGLFTTSPDGTDLLPEMQRHISGSLQTHEPYPGAFRPAK